MERLKGLMLQSRSEPFDFFFDPQLLPLHFSEVERVSRGAARFQLDFLVKVPVTGVKFAQARV